MHGTMTAYQTPTRDKVLAGTGTAAIVGVFGYLLILGLTVTTQAGRDAPLAVLDVRTPPPPPPPHAQPIERKQGAVKKPASPKNIRSKATDVVAPRPVIVLPPIPTIIVAPKAGVGTAATNGASDRPGTGQGAGGEGDGTGGGGDGGGDVGPEQIRGSLKYSDLPAAMREAGVGATLSVRYHVEADGRVSDCTVSHTSGNAELDATTCRLIQQRFRFDPSRDENGRPVRSTVVENHSWSVDRSDEAPPAQ